MSDRDDSSNSSGSDEEDALLQSEEELSESGSPSIDNITLVKPGRSSYMQKKCKYIAKYPDPNESLRLIEAELRGIKLNISLAVAKLDVRPGFVFWLERLSSYLNLYGLHMCKTDHVYFVDMLCKIATNLDLEPVICNRVLGVLTDGLLRGFYLQPSDLDIDWRSWYKLYYKYHFGYDSSRSILIHQRNMDSQVAKTVVLLQKFFSVESTHEIIAEAKQYLVPTSLVHSAGVRILCLFLPTYIEIGKESFGYKVWFDELMNLWTENMNLETMEDVDLISLFRRLSRHNMGRIDWEPFLPKLYTRVLKYFGLPLALPRSVGVSALGRKGTSDKSGHVIQALAELAVNTIDHKSSALVHLKLLFSSLQNYYHPSNLVGPNTTRLTFFMGNLLKRFLERVIAEREECDKWNMKRQATESFLTEEQISEFVSIVEPSVLLSVFIKGQSVSAMSYETNPLFFVQTLAVLSPETVLPDIFEKLYTALSSLTEPHQLTASLLSMAYVCPSVLTEPDKFPGGRLKILQLLPELLPTIDANDPSKLATATALLSAMFFQIPFVNCAQAGLHNKNLTEEELELCHYTANFEDILVQLVKKYIIVFNSMRSVENFMEVSTGSYQNVNAAIKSVGSHLINSLTACLTSLIANCSKEIAKLLIQELFNYISTTIINVNSGFGFISKVFTLPAVEAHPDIAGPMYVPHVLGKLRQLANGHNLVSETEVDKEFLWYAAVFDSELELCHYTANFEDILVQLVKKYIIVFNSMRSVENFMEVSTGPYQNVNAAIKSVGSHLINSLTACLTSLIANCSKEIAKLLIQELFNFISTTIINVNSGFGFISKVFKLPAVEAHPDIAGPMYVPHVLGKLRQLANGHNLVSKTEVDKEFLWYAAVFDSFASFRGHEFEPQLFECLQLLLKAKHVDIYRRACTVLQGLLASRLSPCVLPSYWLGRTKESLGFDKYVPIIEIGRPMDLKSLHVEWRMPDCTGVAFVERLVEEIMQPCVDKLTHFSEQVLANTQKPKSSTSNFKDQTKASRKQSFSREDLVKELTIVHSFVEGLACSLAGLDSEHILTTSQKCELTPHLYNEEYLTKSFKRYNTLRKDLAMKMHDLLNAMLSNDIQENDTKSLVYVSKILRLLLLEVGGKSKLMQNFCQTKTSKNYLLGKKRFKEKKLLYAPMEVNEILLHYKLTKTWRRTPGLFGPTCALLANDIWKLATSRYPVVRSDAHISLSTLIHVYKYSSRIFVPLIEKTLLNPKSYHQYKGALHALCASNSGSTLLEIMDFEVQHQLWIAVLNCYSTEVKKESQSVSIIEGELADGGDSLLGNVIESDLKTAKLNADGKQDGQGDVSQKDTLNGMKHADDPSSDDNEDPNEFKKRESVLEILNRLYERITNNCTTVSIFYSMAKESRDLAAKFLEAEGTAVVDLKRSDEILDKENEERMSCVKNIVNDLCAILEKQNVHKSVHTTALRMLQYTCMRRDWSQGTPRRVAKLVLEATLSETAAIRHCGYILTRLLLEINKVRALKSAKPLYQLYNATHGTALDLTQAEKLDEKQLKKWISYSRDIELDATDYNNRQFVDRNFYMFNCKAEGVVRDLYATPKKLSSHFSTEMQQEKLTEVQTFVISWFSEAHNIELFVKHLSAEEKKVGVNSEQNSRERGKFCRYKIWQFIFRFLQEKAFDIFNAPVRKVVTETTDSSHRFLAEFCCGAIHASKLWTYEQCEKCKEYILPIVEAKISVATQDSMPVWDTFFSHAIKDFDPMRIQWLFEWLFQKLSTSFFPTEYNRNGTLLANAVNNLLVCMNFEANSLKERHMHFMMDFMGSRFTKYRTVACQSVSSCIAYYHSQKWWCRSDEAIMDLTHLCSDWWMPVANQLSRKDFVAPSSNDENSAESESAAVLNKMSSISQIIMSLLSFSALSNNTALLYPLLPALCLVDGLDPEPDHVRIAVSNVQKIAMAPLLQSHAFQVLRKSIEKMSESGVAWRSKRLCLVFLQQLALSNLFLILNPSSIIASSGSCVKTVTHTTGSDGDTQGEGRREEDQKQFLKTIQSVIISLLKDDKLEVRELASSTLSGYIHCGLITIDKSLLKKFAKLRAASKLTSKPISKSSVVTDPGMSGSTSTSSSALIERHAGVLGLKACITAYPYTVPEWMPEVLMALADHVCDPTPIEATVRDTLMDFKRTHHDNWTRHKESFTEDQINTLNDILISPSYYV